MPPLRQPLGNFLLAPAPGNLTARVGYAEAYQALAPLLSYPLEELLCTRDMAHADCHRIETLSASLRPRSTDSLAAAPKTAGLLRTEVAHAAQSATSGTNRCTRERRVAGTGHRPYGGTAAAREEWPGSHGALNWDADPPSGPVNCVLTVMLVSENCSRGGCVAQVSISHRSG